MDNPQQVPTVIVHEVEATQIAWTFGPNVANSWHGWAHVGQHFTIYV